MRGFSEGQRLGVRESLMRLRGVFGGAGAGYLGMAFFWACSMLTFRSTILLSGESATPGSQTLVVVLSFLANAGTLFAGSALVESKPDFVDKLPRWIPCLMVLIGIVCLAGTSYVQSHTAMELFMVAGSLFTGIGYGLFWGCWVEVYGRLKPSAVTLVIPAAFVVAGVLYLAESAAAVALGIPAFLMMAPLPVISAALLDGCLHNGTSKEVHAEGSRRKAQQGYLGAMFSMGPLILAAIVVSLIFGFAWGLSVFSLGSVNKAHFTPHVPNVIIGVVLFVFTFATQKKLDIDSFYRALPMGVLALFVGVSVFWESYPLLCNGIVTVGYGVFDVLLWVSVAETAFDRRVSGFVAGGLVRSISIFSRLVGIGLGYLMTTLPSDVPFVSFIVPAAAVYIALMAVFFTLTWKGQKGPVVSAALLEETAKGEQASGDVLRAETAFAPENASFSDDLEAFASDYGLTRREAEVVPYIYKGRSAKVIASTLCVSESTVRTHIRRIYEKTEVHSKQELIDLIDRY